jgi:radical SAM protein with 4Fe4S-binding SPASM domain
MYITIYGGEPLLHPDILQAIRLLSESFSCALFINGTLLTSEIARSIARNVSTVNVLLYSHRPKVHDTVTGSKGSHMKAIKGISMLKESGATIGVYTPLMKCNAYELGNLLQFLDGFDIKDFTVFRLHKLGKLKNTFEHACPTEQQFAFASEYLTSVNKEFGNDLTVSYGSLYPDFTQCCGRIGVSVDPYGNIMPCTYLRIRLGDILNDSITRIWNENELLHKLRKETAPDEKCVKCAHLSTCEGGCRGSAYQITGSWEGSDPLCWLRVHE